MMRSVKSRLLAGMFCTSALVLVLFGFGVYETIRRALVEEFDASLLSVARTLAASVEHDEGKFEIEFDPHRLPEFQRQTGLAYFQFWLPDGKVLKRSPSLGKSNLVYFCGESGAPAFRCLVLPDGRSGRAAGIKFTPRSEDNWKSKESVTEKAFILVVAKDATGLEAKVRFVRWLLGSAGAVAMTMSLLVAAAVVRGGLRPLHSLGGRIAAIREEHLSNRIPTAGMPTELEPIVRKLNDMLGRLESAFSRERAFTADVAHELRTPLSGIRSTLEVALSRNRNPAEYQEALIDTLAITRYMQSMVNSLLLLVRLDTGQVKLSCKRLKLWPLVDWCWKPYSEKAQSRGIAFENNISPHLSFKSSREILFTVMSILLNNASNYADDGGRIWVTGTVAEDSIEITVANTGCQLSPEDVAHVFDRLWRADPSRTNTGVHFGLGLSLAQRAVSTLRGTISASVDDTGIFKVNVILPTSS